ncbi:MAG: BatD family protein [Chitinophagales bacterium]|nr:BatD family protein [Chitinophagales bacterium]
MLITACLILLQHSSSAQVRFSASAPKSVPENQNFNLTFTIENANGSNLKLPSLNDFTLLGGPNTSSSMQIINGAVSQSASYTYVLRPKRQGTFKIGKATVEAGGNTLESNELTIIVTAPSAQQPSQPGNSYGNNESAPQNTEELAKQLKNDVFVKVLMSRNSVYKGELLTATYRLYFRQNLNGFNLSKAPSLEGFWSKEVELDPNRRQTVETYNGQRYYVLDILKYNLYPQRSGILQITPAEIATSAQVVVQSKSRDPFESFFNMGMTQEVPLKLRTDVVTVNVKELPDEGKPAGFAGAVGKFNYETSLSATESRTDDAVTYTIKISGVGNLNLIDAPPLQLPDGFEVYDPKVKEKIANNESGISGSKQYDYLLIPRMPGEFTIGGGSFSYFNPSTGRYESINTPAFPLKITGEPSQNVNGNASTYVSKRGVAILGEDIRYIKTTMPPFGQSTAVFFGSTGFIALYTLPFLAFFGLLAVRRRNESLAADITGSKRRKAMTVARKRLLVAEKGLAQKEKKKFYDEVSRAIWGYLGDKLNIDPADLSKEMVESRLMEKQVIPATINRLQELLSACEISLYAPSTGDLEMKTDYASALNLIADLEDEIRN